MSKALKFLKQLREDCATGLYMDLPPLNSVDEAISELEAQEDKSCDVCKKSELPPIQQIMECGFCKQLAHDNFEPKATSCNS